MLHSFHTKQRVLQREIMLAHLLTASTSISPTQQPAIVLMTSAEPTSSEYNLVSTAFYSELVQQSRYIYIYTFFHFVASCTDVDALRISLMCIFKFKFTTRIFIANFVCRGACLTKVQPCKYIYI